MKTQGFMFALLLLAGSLASPMGYSQAEVPSTVPSAPTNLSVTAVSNSQINLSWLAPVNASQINGYKIEVRPGCAGSFSTLIGNTTTTVTNRSSTGLISGLCYEYRVFAINPAGIGNSSNIAMATTWSVPSAPTSLVATIISSSQINLGWTTPSHQGNTPVNGYKIERRDSCTGNFLTLIANTSNTNTAFSNTGLTNATCYQYRVFAHNLVGTSVASNNATATTNQNTVPVVIKVPKAPTDLTLTPLVGKIKLTWKAPSDQGNSTVIGYQIQRNGTILVNNTGNTQTNYPDSSILINHQQIYRVAAWNIAGLGQYSNNVTGKITNKTLDRDNLGQIISDFVKQYNALIKKQKGETVSLIKDCREKIKNADLENRTAIREDCKLKLKEIREKYKGLRQQLKSQFLEFRENAKLLLNDFKELKKHDKDNAKSFKKELKTIEKELKKEQKDFKKEINDTKKEFKKLKKDKQHNENDD